MMCGGILGGILALIPPPILASDARPEARGAVWFMDYCAGCHTMRYLTWQRLTTDLDLPKAALSLHGQLTIPNLAKSWSHPALTTRDAETWFGKMPPDLSTIARLRGVRWLQAYLRGFYSDPSKPYGVSNVMMPEVMMPNVLSTREEEMTSLEFVQTVNDIVSFLDYAAEPTAPIRYRMGGMVVSFFVLFALVFGLYYRNRE